MSSQAKKLLELHRNQVRPTDTKRDVMSRLGLTDWQARVLLAEWRKEQKEVAAPKLHEHKDGTATLTHVDAVIRTPEQLFEIAEVDLDKWEPVSSRVNTYPVVTKDSDNQPVVTRLWQVEAKLVPRTVPRTPPNWKAPPVWVAPTPDRLQARQAVIIPDAQIGYRWRGLNTGKVWLDPHHDRKAIDLTLQVIAKVKPDTVVILGDMLDFAPWSTRWTVEDDARQTSTPALMEWRWLLWRIRGIAPNARILYMEGNHEQRIQRLMTERAPELTGLLLPDGKQLMGLATWLGLDDLGVEYVPYPKTAWLYNDIKIMHGTVVKSGGGQTSAALVKQAHTSTLYGHIHRMEHSERTIEDPGGGRRVVWAASPGCLCRTDGAVPGSNLPDWQQGVGLVTAMPGEQRHDLQLISIQNGKAVLGGEILEGRDYVEELAQASGFDAMLPK